LYLRIGSRSWGRESKSMIRVFSCKFNSHLSAQSEDRLSKDQVHEGNDNALVRRVARDRRLASRQVIIERARVAAKGPGRNLNRSPRKALRVIGKKAAGKQKDGQREGR
jgi:hypothetical protein